MTDRKACGARSLGLWEADEVLMVLEERGQRIEQNVHQQGGDRVRVTREWFSHGEDGTEMSLSLSRLNARLQGRRGRNGSTSKQDFEADTPGHVWFLDRQNATYQGCH